MFSYPAKFYLKTVPGFGGWSQRGLHLRWQWETTLPTLSTALLETSYDVPPQAGGQCAKLQKKQCTSATLPNITLPWQIMRTSEQEVPHRWLTTHKALGLSAPMEMYPALGETTKWAPCLQIPDGEIHSAKNYIGTASHTDSECLLSTACFWAPSISGSFQLVKSSCKSKGLCASVRKHIKSFPILQLPHLLPTTTMNKKACMSSDSLSINHSIWQKAHWTTPS